MRYAVVISLLLSAGSSFGRAVLPDSLQVFLAREPKDSAYIVQLNKLAFSCLRSSPEDGRELAAKSIEFSRAISFKRGLARALDVTGSSYWVVGDYESALKYYQLSAGESRKVRDSVGLSSIYHNIGEVYKKLGDYNQSINFLNQSLLMDTHNRNHYGITLYNIGEAFLFKKEYTIASDYFEKALSSAISDKDNRTLAYSYQGLGVIEFEKQNYKGALDYFTKAEKLWNELGELRSLIQTYVLFSDTFEKLGHNQHTWQYLEKASRLASQIHAPDLQIVNYQKMTHLLAAQKKHQKALEVMEKYVSLKDSVYNLKKTESIRRLQAEFEAEEREEENKQLKAEQQLKDSLIDSQRKLIIAAGIGLFTAGMLVWFLFRQRKKISEVNWMLTNKTDEIEKQKIEIEQQAFALRQLNDKLQNLNKNLEQRIDERTHQLILQNKKLAAYAHTNAHQLRAPVASILGLLLLLDRLELNQEDKELVHYLQQCGNDLDKITRDIGKELENEIVPLGR